jgi:hypothetical protein
LVVIVALAAAVPAGAQMRQMGGGYLMGSFPQGDWGKIAGFGLALDGTDIVKPNANKALGIRSNMGLLYNFSRTVDVPASNVGADDRLSIETKNWSVLFGLGPELSAPNKTVTPFVFGTVGFDTYWTSSTLSGTAVGTAYSAEHGDSRISFAWSAGGGLRRQVTAGEMAEISVEYRSGTDHEFLLPSDVSVSGGAVRANRSSHSSDQLLLRVGTVFGSN